MTGKRIKRTVNGANTWQVYGFAGELLAEYPANGPAASPTKEYGYRNREILVTLDAPASGPNGYAYRRTITIDHTKVPNTDQTNFPVLMSGTYSYLATTANGGNVQNANGFDVIFASDSNCTTKLNHEVETYNAASGAVNYWIKVPTLSHSADTTIYLCYGNAAVSTDQSNKTGVWDANYKGVWHLANGSSLSPGDSTGNSNNGTITGAVATVGRTDGGASFNGSSDHVEVKAGKVDTSANSGTVSAWVKASALDENGVVLGYGGAVATDPALWGVYIREVSGNYYFAMSARKTNSGAYSTVRGSTVLASGTWYYVTYSSNGSSWKIRVNGAAAETLTNVLGTNTGDWIGDISPTTPDKSDIGGVYVGGSYSSVNFWHGVLDEVRLSNIERSDDWVTTEYNNQNSPATFYSVSSATSLTVPAQVSWLVTDQLGTPRMIIDQSGSLANVKRHDYLPFGEELFAGMGARTQQQGYWSNDGIRQQFTQKERDVETGLDYFQARYCSSPQGRFTSPDPTLLSVNGFNPQTWNRYTYVLNNPLAYVDPLGLWALQSQTIYRTDENGNAVLDKKGRRIVDHVVVTAVRTSDKDTAASLAEQLGLTGKNAEDFAQRVGDGNNIRLSEQGGEVTRVFTIMEQDLKQQAKFEIEHPDRPNQGPDSADCSETACRIAFPEQMFGTLTFSVQGADALISANGQTTSVQEDNLSLGDIVRWADTKNNPKHFATFIFRNDDGVPVVFSKSGARGPYEIGTTNEIGSGYGTIRGIQSGQTGYYHPRQK
jgi:RHS repeat-associated protein